MERVKAVIGQISIKIIDLFRYDDIFSMRIKASQLIFLLLLFSYS
jgi:hypothetical protein